jgi:hypothetical protein
MEKYIKYERITGQYSRETLQEVLDNIIKNGQEITFYNERLERINNNDLINVVIVVGKKQNNVL